MGKTLRLTAGLAVLFASVGFGGQGASPPAGCAAVTNSWTFSGRVPAGGMPQRLKWDVDHAFDIPEKGCIEFDFRCSNAKPFWSFTLHARRGSLWVPFKFEPDFASGERHVVVARSDWNLKDLPGRKLDDWNGFDGFRLSAWRIDDAPADVACAILNFAVTTNEVPLPPVPTVVKPAPKPGERRLAWCHRAWGMSERTTWDGTIRQLKACGFTDVVPNMCRPGGAYYASTVLPVMPYVAEHGDQLAACLAACRKYGVKCHVWKICWNIGRDYADGFVERMRAEGRLAVSSDGSERKWLCPSHPANRQSEIDAMMELAAKGVDGIHFDFIRYSAMDVCFCERCRAAFEKKYGRTVNARGFHIDSADCELFRKWTDFRCENITAVVRETSERVRKACPGVEISAAVFARVGELTRVNVAQDWGAWCRERYVDFVCPMTYVSTRPQYLRILERIKAPLAGVKCYPGIGCSVMDVRPRGNKRAKAARVAEQVEALRAAGFGGFTVFDYTPPTADVLGKLFRQ